MYLWAEKQCKEWKGRENKEMHRITQRSQLGEENENCDRHVLQLPMQN